MKLKQDGVVLLFPTIRPVTAANMNYAVVVAVVIAFFSLTWWWAGARKTYTGPKTKELLEIVAQEEGDVDGVENYVQE